MDANFSGPSYTLGIEEELMILDGETFALANEIDAVIDAHEGSDGEVKHELLQSVLEIATPVSKDIAEVGRHLRRLRREVSEAAEVLDPEVLTIGFARRFATYKRATLVMRDPARLAKIVNDAKRPVQFLFAGKAHQKDEPGKELIRKVVHLAGQSEFRHRIVFLEEIPYEETRRYTKRVLTSWAAYRWLYGSGEAAMLPLHAQALPPPRAAQAPAAATPPAAAAPSATPQP